jgi:hypothetical protein
MLDITTNALVCTHQTFTDLYWECWVVEFISHHQRKGSFEYIH